MGLFVKFYPPLPNKHLGTCLLFHFSVILLLYGIPLSYLGSILGWNSTPKTVQHHSFQLQTETPLLLGKYAFFDLLMFSTATTHENVFNLKKVTFVRDFSLWHVTFSSQKASFYNFSYFGVYFDFFGTLGKSTLDGGSLKCIFYFTYPKELNLIPFQYGRLLFPLLHLSVSPCGLRSFSCFTLLSNSLID